MATVAPKGKGRVVKPHRWPILLVILLVVGALVYADQNQNNTSHADAITGQGLMPVASTQHAVSSNFYCAGGTAAPGGAFDSQIVIANPNPSPITTSVTVYPAAAPGDTAGQAAVAALKPVTKQVSVGPRTRIGVRLSTVQQSPYAAALVETSDPDVAVEHTITGKQGVNSSPCASAPSSSWYFPTGSTTRDARELLAIFNPFPADAVVDVTYQTNDGFRAPDGEQGLPITAGHLRIVDVTADVPRLEQLAAFVSARSGQVVVDRLQSFDGTDSNHPAGTAATLGAPQAAPVWSFPHGSVTDSVRDTITLVNPSDDQAQVQLEITLDDPATNGIVDPIPIAVPARGFTQVPLQDQTRVPKGVGLSVTVRSIAGPGIVAERVLSASYSSNRQGYAPAIGAPLQATRWLFADGGAVPKVSDEILAVFNPSPDQSSRVSVTAMAQGQPLAIDGLQNVELPPGARVALDLGQYINRPDLTVITETTLPTVVERAFGVNGGLSFSAGMPLSGTTSVPVRAAPTTTTTTTAPATTAPAPTAPATTASGPN